MNQRTADWYEGQTGLDANRGAERIAKIEAFLKTNDVTLSDVEIYTRDVDTRKYGYRALVNKPGRVKIGSTGRASNRSTEYYIQLR